MKRFLLPALFAFVYQLSVAQCEVGEVAVTMTIHTDPWGQETYWELVPSGNGCGNGTIAFGSNAEEVGCLNSFPVTDTYGYPDNTVIEEGPFCLTEGDFFDLHFVDSYGDGGLVFEIYYNGVLAAIFYGSGSGNVWTFQAGVSNLPDYDMPCGATEVVANGASATLMNANAIGYIGEIAPPSVNCNLPGAWCESGVSNSVWAWFTVPDAGTYQVSTCNPGTTFDTQIAVWQGSDCAELNDFTLISSNDDAGCSNGGAFYSSICYVSCLEPGTVYYVQIDGWAGETGTAILTVTSAEGDEQLDAYVSDISCPLNKGETGNGWITPFIYNSGSNFSCTWNGPDGYSSNDNWLFNLGPGEYELTATSACGTVFNASYTINQPTGWSVNFDVALPACPQSENGEVEVLVSGATPPYNINWIGPDGFSGEGPVQGELIPGDYSIYISDERGCQYNQEITLNAANNFTFDLGNDTTVCLGETFVIYGPAGLNYSWQDGSSNQFYEITTSDWGTGTHVVILTATTDDGCVYSDPFIFNVEICEFIGDKEIAELHLYPNPTEGVIFIENPAGIYQLCQVFDATGRMVRSERISGSLVQLELDLPKGAYSVLCTGQDTLPARQQIVIR
jgi:hypothetical protein